MNYAEEIQSFIEMLTDDEALNSISKDGGVNPTFIFLLQNENGEYGNAVIDPPKEMFDDRVKKDMFMKLIFPKIKEQIINDGNKIISIAFVCEAWKSADESLLEGGKLDESNSDEILMVSVHYEGNKIDFFYPIIRIAGKMTFGNKEVMQSAYDSEKSSGRFAELM